ncbi:ParB-like chromosome segregation protein Spo0J [Bradyrhizobium sp. i1.8.4]
MRREIHAQNRYDEGCPKHHPVALTRHSVNTLALSPSNVRHVKAGISIEQLAERIAARTLLQSPNVGAVVDGEGNETGTFEVPAGGRRYRALELLVKQKRMAKTQAVPCVV